MNAVQAPKTILDLVEQSKSHRCAYTSPEYNETQKPSVNLKDAPSPPNMGAWSFHMSLSS